MNLQKGQITDSGFSIIDIVDLAEMKATGIWAKHLKCGVEVFHVLNDDIENLFAFAFATTSQDNTGVAHILEHSVLCGSERYPLKDAFLVLAQGSLQTFLNAWTFPDKTVYPASSVNERDYFNLMSVYGDAVFRPLLSEWTFMQEGHRYEFIEGDGSLSITGVVYNEMKGAYSSLDCYASHWSVKAVLPDTPYRFESGGDPDHIPELNWEGLKEFHRSRYSPANCRIFLAGNIPTEKQLAFLSDQFFSSMEAGTSLPPLARQQRWDTPKEFRIPCPAGGDNKATVFLSWLCADIAEMGENIALNTLTEILLGHDGSPLMRALVESSLGEDITPVSGFEWDLGQTLFIAGLRGVDGNEKQVEKLILDELRRLTVEGIPREEIEAALLSMEFSQREVKRAGGPFSLVWMQRSLREWLHGGKPWESLLLAAAIADLKKRLAENNRFFENLIEKYLLNNHHRALVMIEPQENFLSEKEKVFAEAMANTSRNLSTVEKESITEKSAALERIQNEDDKPEALAAIPHLSRSDLSPEPEQINRRHEDLRGIPALCHDMYTNGITYIDLAFPLDILPREDYLWIAFFTQAVISVGLPGMDYAEVSSLLARTVGDFTAITHTGSAAPSVNGGDAGFDLAGRDWIIYRLKCLEEKAAPALDLALRLISEADFSDTRRIRDLVLEMKNEARSSLAPHGHNYASCRAGRFTSPSNQTREIWNGLTQLTFAHRLAELDSAEVAAKLQNLRETIVSSGVIASLTGSAGALKAGGALVGEKFSRFGPPIKAPGTKVVNSASPRTLREEFVDLPVTEVFASPSLQVGFAAMTLEAAPYDTREQIAEMVLAHQLSKGELWESIRMKGGAYGVSASSDGIERCFSFSTYRDPTPQRSLDVFSAVLKGRAADSSANDDFQEDLEKMIIGCYAHETRPHTPAEKNLADFLRFVSLIDDGCRRRKLERLINISEEDISAALGNLASQFTQQNTNPIGRVVITGMNAAEQTAKALGVEPQILPV